jgi:hypothetical protein
MKHSIHAGWLASFLLLAAALAATPAGAVTVTINDVNTNVNGALTDIGTISVTIPGPNNFMEATFTVDPEDQYLCAWTDFHWVQIIVHDDCPATVAGAVPAFPVVDTPANGWDYMYNDLDFPPDGIQADERVPGNTTGPEWNDDATDTQPWYLTAQEENTKNNICQTYDIWDTKSDCDPADGNPWVIRFRTWLVARTPVGGMCLIRGFEWAKTEDGLNQGPTDLGAPTVAHATQVGNALTNGGIAGWAVGSKCNITSPPQERVARWRRHPTKGYEILSYIYTNTRKQIFFDALGGTPVKIGPGDGSVMSTFTPPFTPDDLFIAYRFQNMSGVVWHHMRIDDKGSRFSWDFWCYKRFFPPYDRVMVCQDPLGHERFCLTNVAQMEDPFALCVNDLPGPDCVQPFDPDPQQGDFSLPGNDDLPQIVEMPATSGGTLAALALLIAGAGTALIARRQRGVRA